MWVAKVKGVTYYCESLHSDVGFSTKNTPGNEHTKGSLKFKNVDFSITSHGDAYITKEKYA